MKTPLPVPLLSDAEFDEFWSNVELLGPTPEHRQELGRCWIWTGTTRVTGYGLFTVRKRLVAANRLAASMIQTLGKNHLALHACDNPRCIRPSHLFVGTHTENMRDKVAKRRENLPTGDRHFSHTHPELMTRGEQHHWRVLTEREVLAIRAEYAAGKGGYINLGRKFATTSANIRAIVKRRSWKHI